MSRPETNTNRKAAPGRPVKAMYRGIVLPTLTAPSRIPLADIERAVKNAFAKRSTALAED